MTSTSSYSRAYSVSYLRRSYYSRPRRYRRFPAAAPENSAAVRPTHRCHSFPLSLLRQLGSHVDSRAVQKVRFHGHQLTNVSHESVPLQRREGRVAG